MKAFIVAMLLGFAVSAQAATQLLSSVGAGAENPCGKINVTEAPDIAAGETVTYSSTLTPSGKALTVRADCSASFSDAPGQQHATFSVSGHTGSTVVYFNDTAPDATDNTDALLFKKGNTAASDFSADFDDADGDTLTGSITSATGTGANKRPAGTSVSGFTLTGPLSTAGSGNFNLTATDPAGLTVTKNYAWYVIDVAGAPDCATTHLSLGDCVDALHALFLEYRDVTFAVSSSVSAGNVISQSVTPGTTLDPFEAPTFDIVVSRGTASIIGDKDRNARFGFGSSP